MPRIDLHPDQKPIFTIKPIRRPRPILLVGEGKLDDVLATRLAEHSGMEAEDRASRRMNRPLPKRTLQAVFDEKVAKKKRASRKKDQIKAKIEEVKKAVRRGGAVTRIHPLGDELAQRAHQLIQPVNEKFLPFF